MLKFLMLPALLVVAFTMACSSSLSLDEYAEWCGELHEDYDISLDGSSSAADVEEALEEWKAVNPPEEVKELHDLTAEAFGVYIALAEQGEDLEDRMDDLKDDLEDAPRSQRDDIEEEIEDLEDEVEDLRLTYLAQITPLVRDAEDLKEDLPRRVERVLEREDCN